MMRRHLVLLLALAVVLAVVAGGRPYFALPTLTLPHVSLPDPLAILLVLLFVLGLAVRAKRGLQRNTTRDQRRAGRRFADDVPVHGKRRPSDLDPALPLTSNGRHR